MSASDRFVITRESGQSDAEVLAEIVEQATPGQVLEYDFLASRLSAGTTKKYERCHVQQSVTRAERKLSLDLSRSLINIRNKGYKVAPAGEHVLIASRRRQKAGSMLDRGLRTLQHVRWEEMDENQRQAHQGQLMVISALHSAMDGIDKRLSRIENAIEMLERKVHSLRAELSSASPQAKFLQMVL